MTSITEELNEEIAKAGGDTRRALISMMAGRDAARTLLETEQERSAMLLDVLETIRTVTRVTTHPIAPLMMVIDRIAGAALRVSGQIPTTTEED